MIDSGRLRHRIRIEELAPLIGTDDEVIQDETGEISRAWTEVATVWAAIEPLSAREYIQSQTTQSQVSARVTIRYRSGLNAAMRLVHLVNGVPGRIYNPAAFLTDKDSGLEYLTMPCSEGVGEGQ
jgi:SPP1 family predicted phage head-tail adaptor